MQEHIAATITELIGNTPLLELSRYAQHAGVQARLLGKLEYFNPLGSVKDRVGLALIEDAEAHGIIEPGATIIEPTSGNTGIALAFAAVAKGYKLILTMPDTMSIERRQIVAALGARVELTEGSKGMAGAIERAEELHASIKGSMIAGQFTNPANPSIHEQTTAQEIWRDTAGGVEAFVAGVGSGGTISGTGRGLKKENASIHIVAVEPQESPVLSGGPAGAHGIQGIGANLIPSNYDASVVDEVVSITTARAYEVARTLARTEGLLLGISSGAALAAATDIAWRPEWHNKTIVVLLPDTGERYMSAGLWREEPV